MKTEGFTQAEIEIAEGLISMGAVQQDEVPRAFWMNGHCFYISPEKGLIEL